jgi:hypothetical protein
MRMVRTIQRTMWVKGKVVNRVRLGLTCLNLLVLQS